MSPLLELPTRPSPEPAWAPFPTARWTVPAYLRMIRSGALAEDQRVELIFGWIVPQMPQGPRHRAAISCCRAAFSALLPAGWFLDEQQAIDLTAVDGRPEPDIQVARGRSILDYRGRDPAPDDLALILEVADSSYPRDRGEKLELYARGGVGAYWILDLNRDLLEVFDLRAGREPVRVLRAGDEAPLDLDATLVAIPVAALIPPTFDEPPGP